MNRENTPRLNQQFQFILEVDKLKTILRETSIGDDSRRENSAEHSWHLAMMALTLAEYAPDNANLLQAIKMLLLHDVVEIDAGDTFCYDIEGNQDKAAREAKAADRIFGLLPPDQGKQLRALWEEFERGITPTAQFAIALDRLQPLLLNAQNQGGTWTKYNITEAQVRQRVGLIQTAVPQLWPFVEKLISDCIHAGNLKPSEDQY